MTDRVGQQFGNYHLASLLGQGGYAEVYLGQHVRLDLQAAIKVLHTHLTGSEAEHFQQEAQTIAKLSHPSIIRVFDFDVQEGTPFLVMDYAPNGSLRQRYPRGSLVPLPVIVSSVKQVSDALQYAHEQKFIHRDVKPENMLLGRRQDVLLSDFGIATIAHSTSSLNMDGQGTSGTLAYMAPEQIEGHPRPASDQYALAVVVYEWLCGERPFEGSVSELIAQQLSMTPPPLRERVPAIPAEIEQVVLRALSKDSKARFASVAEFARALEQASQRALTPTGQIVSEQPVMSLTAEAGDGKEDTPSAELPVGAHEPTVYPDSSTLHGHDTPQSGAVAETPQRGQLVAPTSAVASPPLEPTMPVKRKAKRLSRTSAVVLIGLAVLVVAVGFLGSLSLLAHFGVIGARSGVITPVRGGTWTLDTEDTGSLIPIVGWNDLAHQALYLPLFYGDAQGVVHPGAATEVPSLQNGGISLDAKTWTFHLRPHLVWSDGQPYDARDVDFTWKLWKNPKFDAYWPLPSNLNSKTEVSSDDLSITFHLTRAYAPFLQWWVDGIFAPLPAHHFSMMAPEQILKSPDNLNPQVVSGPFMMAESKPSDHYTMVRNPRYYRSSEGLPYLDKLILRISQPGTVNQDLLAGSVTSVSFLDPLDVKSLRLTHYTVLSAPISAQFEMLYFNFHNTVLANHPEVRQAMAAAIDRQALIDVRLGFAQSLCTDHPSAMHPRYDFSPCSPFDPVAANKLLQDNGWVKGKDGVRTRNGQRLEFEYSSLVHLESQRIIQRNMQAIGIKLDIQNYADSTIFYTFVAAGKASPPTGAIAGRYDIGEWGNNFGYDPDDSWLLSCDQFPPQGQNFDFYCNHQLDVLYQQELATPDLGVRQNIFTQIHEIYLTELPFIPLFSPLDIAPVHKGTHNYQINPFEFEGINVWEWWCDGGKC